MIGLLPPIVVAVCNCNHVERLQDEQDTLNIWSADVKIGRHGFGCKTFEKVLVAEVSCNSDNPEAICILGFHNANHNPSDVGNLRSGSGKSWLDNKEAISNQKKFVLEIEKEEKYHKESRGLIGRLFAGYNYPVQARVLNEYARARRIIESDFIMSYFSDAGEFETERCNPSDIMGEPRDAAYTAKECRERYHGFDEWANEEVSIS